MNARGQLVRAAQGAARAAARPRAPASLAPAGAPSSSWARSLPSRALSTALSARAAAGLRAAGRELRLALRPDAEWRAAFDEASRGAAAAARRGGSPRASGAWLSAGRAAASRAWFSAGRAASSAKTGAGADAVAAAAGVAAATAATAGPGAGAALSASAAAAAAAAGAALSSSAPQPSPSSSSSSSSSSSGERPRGSSRAPPSLLQTVRRHVRILKQLSKWNLTGLVVSSAAAGFVAGSPASVDWAGLGWTCLGTGLCSASANTLNQVYEVANDALMRRTMARPLPSGRTTRGRALAFAGACAVLGGVVLAAGAGELPAALGIGNIVLYAGVYTPMKQVSYLNTWVGAVVGAIPPALGWAAAAGGLDVGAAVLGAALYFWQLPHFMAIAMMGREDYRAGGYRMLTLEPRGARRAARCALRNCFYLFPLGFLAASLGVTTPAFAYESALITAGMTLCAARFASAPTLANARVVFRASLLHLPAFMLAFLAHRVPNPESGLDRLELLREHARKLGIETRREDAHARAEATGDDAQGRAHDAAQPTPSADASASADAADASPPPAYATGPHRTFGWRIDADAPPPPALAPFWALPARPPHPQGGGQPAGDGADGR